MIEQLDKMINKDTQLLMQKICRSCMCESSEMRSVFESKEAEHGQIQLSEMLMACASIEVMLGDGLPIQLCIACEIKLDSAFEFKQQCQRADTSLRELTNQRKKSVKQESLDTEVRPDSYNDQGGDSDNSVLHPKVTSTELNVFTCTYCQKVLRTKKGLKIHERRHTGEKLRSCHLCEAKFTRTNHLRRHIETHNKANMKSAKYICIECGACFTKPTYLINHKKEHKIGNNSVKKEIDGEFDVSHNADSYESNTKYSDETWIEYKDEILQLNKQDDNSDNSKLKENDKTIDKKLRHSRVHTGERPYVCNLCGRAFTQSNDLALHMRRHTGSRPYACGVCPSRFIQSGQLKAHRRATGHWMETQPDLKGGHRVEPVTPVENPVPIKFKTHGKPKCKLDENEEGNEPKILGHTIGIMGNVNIQNESLHPSESIVINSTKFLQQIQNGGYVGFASVISNASEVLEENVDKFKSEGHIYSVSEVAHEEIHIGIEKMEVSEETELTYTAIATEATEGTNYNNVERYNYQNFG